MQTNQSIIHISYRSHFIRLPNSRTVSLLSSLQGQVVDSWGPALQNYSKYAIINFYCLLTQLHPLLSLEKCNKGSCPHFPSLCRFFLPWCLCSPTWHAMPSVLEIISTQKLLPRWKSFSSLYVSQYLLKASPGHIFRPVLFQS